MFRGFILASLLLLQGCSWFSDSPESDFSSPKDLYVNQISSHTAGVISVASPVRVRFTQNVRDSLLKPGDLFQFEPDIHGNLSWEDERTAVFQPATALPSDKTFRVTLNLEPLYPDIDQERRLFRFTFQTLKQNFEVRADGLVLYEASDLTRMKVEGAIQVADLADEEKLKNMLRAVQEGDPREITWGELNTRNELPYTVENVVRKERAGELIIYANGEPLGLDKKSEIKIPIPALGDYSVLSSRLHHGNENYISVIFSDPVDPGQNFSGLVTLTGQATQPRVVIDLNEMKVYPASGLSGEVRLTIHQGVKNTAGYSLTQNYETQLSFVQTKPEVRLVSGQGTILPDARERVMPFEATGLNAVDVTVVKIFPENVVQYLQVNALGGDSELSRVGRPVIRKTIPLNTTGVTNLNTWNRYFLDLSDLFDTQPGVMYQVRIGFRKAYSEYYCSDGAESSMTQTIDEWDNEEEELYWDSYEYYYNPDFNWEERDDPCSNSYYGGRRTVSKVLMSSNLGIIAKKSDEGNLTLFVTDILKAQPLSGAAYKLYDYQQQLISEGQTDGSGTAVVEKPGKPFILEVTHKKDIGYLKLDDGSALSMSNFDVSGQRLQKGLKGFIYGERGVWRPSDTLHLAFILEDGENKLPATHPVIMELRNPAGQLTSREVRTSEVPGIYRFDFITDRDAPTGNWRATAKAGGASFSKTIRIETIKPNRLKVNLDFDNTTFTANEKTIDGDIQVRWLSGATASNLKVEYEMMLVPVSTTFKSFPAYSFDDPAREFKGEREMVYQGKLDENGYARMSIKPGKADQAPGMLMARFYGKVYEEGGDFSISNNSVTYIPYESLVGVKTPSGDERGMLLTDQDHTVQIASVNAEGKPVDRNNVKIELFKVSWRWWWDNSYEDISNYVGRSHRDPIMSDQVDTREGKGTWTMRIDQPEWGRYYLRVTDPVSGHSAGQIVYVDWPGWAGKGRRGELDGASMLDFNSDREEYQVGDEISLTIPSTTGNMLLVSLETGSDLLETFWVNTEQEKTEIRFKATTEMAPNIYVHLSMLRPHETSADGLPIRLYGAKSLKISDPGTQLKPVIRMPQSLRPEEKFTIHVTEENGRAMGYTLAIVDEGLLDITNFNTPDPWTAFYEREALGVRTWDVYDDVMGAYGASMERMLAIGGDGELNAREETELNRFKPVVKFLGPFYLKAGSENIHEVVLPQYIGSVRTMVIAAGNGAFGHAEKATPVKQEVMVLATMPRVAGPGEKMKLPVNVFAMEEGAGEIQVSVKSTGNIRVIGSESQTIRLSKKGDEVIYFDVQSLEATGPARIRVEARSSKASASYDVEMNVIPRNPAITVVSDKILAAGEHWNFNYQPIGLSGRNSGTVEISSMPPLNLEKRMNFLIRYPHGCVEQTVSAAFAQLYLDVLTTLTEEKALRVQKNIEQAISRMSSFQTGEGGFSYWPGGTYPNLWGSNYAGHFLLEAKARGYYVPQSLLSGWVNFQNNQADAWGRVSSDRNDDLIQAYRLYTLALAGSANLGAMNRMKESPGIGTEARWRLALAYAVAGYKDQAKQMVRGLIHTPQVTKNYHQTFGSLLRDQAMILETQLLTDSETAAFSKLKDISAEMSRETWLSTQTTAYCLVAIGKYAETYGVASSIRASVKQQGNSLSINADDFIHLTPVEDPDQTEDLLITNNGDKPLYIRMVRQGVPLEGSENAIEKNIRMEVVYTDLDGQAIDPSILTQGTNFKAVVTISNPGLKGNLEEIALTQIFPSGWEIINTRLDGSAQQSRADYTDIRDDRLMHYFNLAAGRTITFEVLLNASYAGTYYKPAIQAEAMYDNEVQAVVPGAWVEVKK